jgi:transaldolase
MVIPSIKFSLWADFIERDFIKTDFQAMIDKGIINGATSNPAIFKSAILTSPAYKAQLETLTGLSPKAKYEAVAIYDIQQAADVLRRLYDAGNAGFVSIEVYPFLCDDGEATLEDGTRLHAAIGRPNVMIKVPATDAGYQAMEGLVSEGINVNATLIFSKEQAINCAEAFARGVEKQGTAVDTVISVFVSRIDRALDGKLGDLGLQTGVAGVYNAAGIYNAIEALNVPGCRTLFASTGVKGDDLKPSYYVEELLAPNSVNTAPVATIDAYVANATGDVKLPLDQQVIDSYFAQLEEKGIVLDPVIEQQIHDGLEAFKVAFQEILDELE